MYEQKCHLICFVKIRNRSLNMLVYSHYAEFRKYYRRWLLWMASIGMWGCQHS